MSVSRLETPQTGLMIKFYPIGLIVIGVLMNLLIFSVQPTVVTLPRPETISALTFSAILLLANRTWLMTTTELTRMHFDLAATPEEWAEKSKRNQDISRQALEELERRHNAHRNATENVVYFVLLAVALAFVSPTALAMDIWVVGFCTARLGYTYSYLAGRTGLRGFFMSLSLLALYGMASYLVLSGLL